MTRRKDGSVKFILAMDCETSAICWGARNLATDETNPSRYAQPVSWGILIPDADTYEEIAGMYIEIKRDGKSMWDERAESIHGLSKAYLEEHGVSEEDAVIQILNLIYKYFGNGSIMALGHNVAFDIAFMEEMCLRYGIKPTFGSRRIDSMSIGHPLLGIRTSDELFEAVGLRDRNTHNALEDIAMTVEAIRRIRRIFREGLE